MWEKPYKYSEGFLIGGGLLAIGTLLQATVGAVKWELCSWPVNVVLLILLLGSTIVIYSLHKRVYVFEWLMHYKAAIPAIFYAMTLTVIMGLTIQTNKGGIPWLSQMLSFWPFVLIYGWMVLIAALATIRRIAHFRINNIPFILHHLGIVIAITAATLGYADMEKLKMTTQIGAPQWRATDEKGNIKELDLAIDLHNFTIEHYPPKLLLLNKETGKILQQNETGWKIEVLQDIPDGAVVQTEEGMRYEPWHSTGSAHAMEVKCVNGDSTVTGWVSCGSFVFPATPLDLDERISLVMPQLEPKRYASEITVYTKKGEKADGVVQVNKPLEIDGWKIYQYSYDETMGKWSTTSIFELVKDPWLPVVYTGIFLMIAGAVCLLFVMAPKPVKL